MTLREPAQYVGILERVVAKIWKKESYFAVVPTTVHLGHLFWEITIAVSIARTTNRSLVLLNPRNSREYVITNKDVFDCDFNCKVEKKKLQKLLMRVLYFYERNLTLLKRLLYRLRQWARHSQRPRPVMRFHRCGIEVSNFVMAKIKGTKNYYDLAYLPESEPSIMLTHEQRNKARNMLAQAGFDDNKWFATAHVRESGYRGHEVYHDSRNFGQHALLPLVKSVVAQDGFVVRLGTEEQSYIPKTVGLFDYAKSKVRSGLLDIYLMEKSKLYLGSSSGTLAMAYAFGKPAFIINYVDFLTAGFRKTDMFMPKMPYDVEEHRYLSIAEYCDRATSTWDSTGVWFVENRLEDIEEAFTDFLEYERNAYTLSSVDQAICQEWQEMRNRTLKRIIEAPAHDDLEEKFKDVAISSLSAPAVLAPSYLRKYLFSAPENSTRQKALSRGEDQ